MRLVLVLGLAVSLLIAACGDEEEVGEPVDGQLVVLMKDNYFEPKKIVVPVGETITVRAVNAGVLPHNMIVVSRDSEGTNFRSDLRVNGGGESTFEMKFTRPGTFEFQCGLHLPGMVGTITAK
jgi:plastocyanin